MISRTSFNSIAEGEGAVHSCVAIMTLAASVWFLLHQRHHHRACTIHDDCYSGYSNSNEEETKKYHNEHHDSHSVKSVSKRGMILSQSSPLPYIKSYFKAISNPCHHIHNRSGYIALCVAENKLVIPELKKLLLAQQHPSSQEQRYDNDNHISSSNYGSNVFLNAAFNNDIHFCYNDTRGLEWVREIIAKFITKRFIKPPHENDKGAMANQIVLGSGAAAILNFLFHCIADENEVVLIPAPYYAAFEYDMSIIAKCIPYPVHMDDAIYGPQIHELERVYKQLEDKGLSVKVLLLTNPNNPLGTIYSPIVVKNCVEWARDKGMHTIVDEIYALSVHDEQKSDFQSVTKILDNKLGDDVHFVWALSKDFGSSGFRVGILYTHNNKILSAFGNINMFSSVSHPMQAIVAELLSNDSYVDHFLDKSRKLLRASYDIVTKALDEIRIPYVSAVSGIFVYCDFSSVLPENTFQGENQLATLFEEYARIVMTPGGSQKDMKPGYFRICYAFVSKEVLMIGMSRLQMICKILQKNGWSDILKNNNVGEVDILDL